jgi:tripartite-type tricarboxylate transporter receptor subunit TctC
MRLPRRSFLQLAAGAALTAGARPASAQAYPTRTVRLIVGFGAGGAPDVLARLVALCDPTLKKRFADLGSMPFLGSPADFGNLIAAETEKWTKVVKFAGIKPQ